nr:hypothetical protein [Candidatus Dadabacteria bacterium]NIQ14897.1 hypothetical protein [Candidatus Dadabacteria bacterium]
MENINAVLELINKGGFFIYPLILCSILAVSIFLQKLWLLRLKNVVPDKFISDFIGILKNGNISEAKTFCESNDSSISKIAITAIDNMGKAKPEIQERIEVTGSSEARFLGKYIEGFGT